MKILLSAIAFFFAAAPAFADYACPTPLLITQIRVGDKLIVCEKGLPADIWGWYSVGDVLQVEAIQSPFFVARKIAGPFMPDKTFSVPMQLGIKLMVSSTGYYDALRPLPPPLPASDTDPFVIR